MNSWMNVERLFTAGCIMRDGGWCDDCRAVAGHDGSAATGVDAVVNEARNWMLSWTARCCSSWRWSFAGARDVGKWKIDEGSSLKSLLSVGSFDDCCRVRWISASSIEDEDDVDDETGRSADACLEGSPKTKETLPNGPGGSLVEIISTRWNFSR